MDSASFSFVAFGLVAAVLSNLSRSRVWRSIVLASASIVFLAVLGGSLICLLPLAGFLILGYAGLFLIQRGAVRLVGRNIVVLLIVYIWLKKYTFLPEGVLLHSIYFTLGVSYILFRMLHLQIEAGDNRELRCIGIGAFLLYTLNFTTLVSGPIQRYEEFARDQFANEPIPLGPRVVGMQLDRIIRGFFKVNVLALLFDAWRLDALSQIWIPAPVSVKIYAAIRIAALYPLFLYSNFSGYIDIVIAIARLMRVRLPENFDRPFSASSFLDFWNRWHITLSIWLKTYVYNPLLMFMMRRISSPGIQTYLGVLCFFVTFFLIGLWHGRTTEFLFFGVLQGAGVAANKLWQIWLTRAMGQKRYKALAENSVYISLGRGLTFSWFAFTLFWFWASWKQIETIVAALSVGQWMCAWLTLLLAATAVLATREWLRAKLLSWKSGDGTWLTSRYARVVYASALCLLSVYFTVLLNEAAPPIVYKAF